MPDWISNTIGSENPVWVEAQQGMTYFHQSQFLKTGGLGGVQTEIFYRLYEKNRTTEKKGENRKFPERSREQGIEKIKIQSWDKNDWQNKHSRKFRTEGEKTKTL